MGMDSSFIRGVVGWFCALDNGSVQGSSTGLAAAAAAIFVPHKSVPVSGSLLNTPLVMLLNLTTGTRRAGASGRTVLLGNSPPEHRRSSTDIHHQC